MAYALATLDDPYRALGRAAALCARHPAFADRPFGQWTRVLMGQVNRGDYRFVLKDRTLIGFLGWVRTDETGAERWLSGVPPETSPDGDHVVLNALACDDPGALPFIAREAGTLVPPPFMLVGKRFYEDGRVRPVRLPIRA